MEVETWVNQLQYKNESQEKHHAPPTNSALQYVGGDTIIPGTQRAESIYIQRHQSVTRNISNDAETSITELGSVFYQYSKVQSRQRNPKDPYDLFSSAIELDAAG